MGDERGHVVEHREYQHQLYRARAGDTLQQVGQQPARVGVEADEGVVHHQHAGLGEQGLGQLELAQLAAAQQDDFLVHERLQPKEVEEVPAPFLVPYRAQLLAHGGCLVLVVGIPALLVVVVGIGAPVGVAEGDGADVVVGRGRSRGAEVVGQRASGQRILARQQVHQQALSRAVGAHDGNVFVRPEGHRSRLSQPHLRQAGHAGSEAYCLLSVRFHIILLHLRREDTTFSLTMLLPGRQIVSGKKRTDEEPKI